jgi:hypothetical protein
MDIDRVCWRIMSAFDFDDTANPFEWGIDGEGNPPDLGQFISDLVSKKQLENLKRDAFGELTKRDKAIFEISLALAYQIPFAFGYVIGQMFDIPSPEVQKEIKKIKKLLKDKALLPYLPRERKAAQAGEVRT